MTLFKFLLYIHVFCGTISLLIGVFILSAKKGDQIHKKVGKLFFYAMLIAALVSFPMSYLHPNYFLFIVGVFTTYMLLTGTRYLKIKKLTDVNNIDWLLAFAMLIFGIAFIIYGFYLVSHSNNFGTVLIVFGSISLLFVWLDYLNFTGKSRYTNYWLVTHIQRMIGSYIATVTAFLVVNNTMLPPTVAWLLPTVVLVPLIVKWVIKYNIRAVKESKNGI